MCTCMHACIPRLKFLDKILQEIGNLQDLAVVVLGTTC